MADFALRYRARTWFGVGTAHTIKPQMAAGADIAIEDSIPLTALLLSASSLQEAFEDSRSADIRGVEWLSRGNLTNGTRTKYAAAGHAAFLDKSLKGLTQRSEIR